MAALEELPEELSKEPEEPGEEIAVLHTYQAPEEEPFKVFTEEDNEDSEYFGDIWTHLLKEQPSEEHFGPEPTIEALQVLNTKRITVLPLKVIDPQYTMLMEQIKEVDFNRLRSLLHSTRQYSIEKTSTNDNIIIDKIKAILPIKHSGNIPPNVIIAICFSVLSSFQAAIYGVMNGPINNYSRDCCVFLNMSILSSIFVLKEYLQSNRNAAQLTELERLINTVAEEVLPSEEHGLGEISISDPFPNNAASLEEPKISRSSSVPTPKTNVASLFAPISQLIDNGSADEQVLPSSDQHGIMGSLFSAWHNYHYAHDDVIQSNPINFGNYVQNIGTLIRTNIATADPMIDSFIRNCMLLHRTIPTGTTLAIIRTPYTHPRTASVVVVSVTAWLYQEEITMFLEEQGRIAIINRIKNYCGAAMWREIMKKFYESRSEYSEGFNRGATPEDLDQLEQNLVQQLDELKRLIQQQKDQQPQISSEQTITHQATRAITTSLLQLLPQAANYVGPLLLRAAEALPAIGPGGGGKRKRTKKRKRRRRGGSKKTKRRGKKSKKGGKRRRGGSKKRNRRSQRKTKK